MVEEKLLFRDASDIERALLDARPLRSASYAALGATSASALAGTALKTPPFSIRADRSYSIDDFCAYDGAAFVAAAYLGLLERLPDAEGAKFFLALRESGVRKAIILGRMHYSTEGRRCNVLVRGLRIRYLFWRACRLPVIGYILESGLFLASLPRMSAAIRRLEYMAESRRLDPGSDR